MTDVYDRATAREEEILCDALQAQARRAGLDGKTVDDSALICRVCEDPIPLARREAYFGVQTRAGCQHELERAVAQWKS